MVAVCSGSPVPVLRAYRGCAPLDTWSRSRWPAANRYAVALLEWVGQLPLTRRSFAYIDRLLTQRGVRVLRVPLSAEDRLEALVTGLSLGDHVSLFLADQRRVDPYPVEAITRLKAALASPRSG